MSQPRHPRDSGPTTRPRFDSRGFTLLELLVALLLLSPLIGAVPPRLGELRDRSAVRGAREAAVGLLVRARTAALVHGEAVLVCSEAPARIELLAHGRRLAAVDLERDFGVGLSLQGPGDRRLLHFDAHGLGRMAGATLRFSRSTATAALTVSSYGRIRRW